MLAFGDFLFLRNLGEPRHKRAHDFGRKVFGDLHGGFGREFLRGKLQKLRIRHRLGEDFLSGHAIGEHGKKLHELLPLGSGAPVLFDVHGVFMLTGFAFEKHGFQQLEIRAVFD